MRSLWSTLVEEPAQRETAYAMVSIVFEVAVVTAPALVAAIVAVSSPQVAVLAAAALGRGRVDRLHDDARLAPLARDAPRGRLARPARRRRDADGVRRAGRLRHRGGDRPGRGARLRARAGLGRRRRRAAGGALGRAASCGGLVYGARSWPGSAPRRLAAAAPRPRRGVRAARRRRRARPRSPCCSCSAALLLAPTTVIGSTLLDTVAPSGTVTEAFTVMVMAIVVGTAMATRWAARSSSRRPTRRPCWRPRASPSLAPALWSSAGGRCPRANVNCLLGREAGISASVRSLASFGRIATEKRQWRVFDDASRRRRRSRSRYPAAVDVGRPPDVLSGSH